MAYLLGIDIGTSGTKTVYSMNTAKPLQAHSMNTRFTSLR